MIYFPKARRAFAHRLESARLFKVLQLKRPGMVPGLFGFLRREPDYMLEYFSTNS
jgi:hypothetical protein